MTNTPTKIIGVRFDAQDSVPTVVLKAAGDEAQALTERARAEGAVPVVQMPDLAERLYRTSIDAPIARELFPVMAALLAHVMRADRTSKEIVE